MKIQLTYVTCKIQFILELELPQEATIQMAINESKILEKFTEISLNENKVGVFGEIAQLDDVLVEGDRIEIYRPLKIHPMQARRMRAQV